MKKRVDLQLWHDPCWMLSLTREYSGVSFALDDVCSDGTDILATVTVSGGDDVDIDAVTAAVTTYPAVRSTDPLDGGKGYRRIHCRYDAERSIYETIVASSLTPIGEIRVADDTEYWTLLADGEAIGASIAHLERVADVDVRRVVDYEPNPTSNRTIVDEICQELSSRQAEYLLSAFEEGYYGWPRDVAASDLAEKHEVSGPTALEHLRKGEATVLERILGEISDRPASESHRARRVEE